MSSLLKAPADGYTLAANTLTLASLFGEPSANFKPEDLQMIARSQIDPYGLIVPASIPFKTLDEFVKYARQNPGKVNVGDQTYTLQKNDIFVVPNWTWWDVEAQDDLVLLSYSDRAALEKLDLWREQRANEPARL